MTWIIYKLTCETGKFYIGKTIMKLNNRLSKHKGKQNRSSNSSTNNFINPTILYICETDDKEQSFKLEQHHIHINPECCNTKRLFTEEQKKQRHAKSMKKWKETEKGRLSKKKTNLDYYNRNKDTLNQKMRNKRNIKKSLLTINNE
tara:strand:- start:1503 stop:1940 length:438 start_codon:yes stop_codon:yes gene_type:complete